MTRARSTYRQRRAGTGDASIPDDLIEWFAGTFEREEPAPPALSVERRAFLESMPAHALGRGDRRALGLPVEPWRPVPWAALLIPGFYLLPDHWHAWAAEHPGATPPAGWAWIADAEPFRGHAAELVEQARKSAGVSARRK